MARLNDKIVLITGAAGAIGHAVAAAVKREGGRAIATDLAGASRHRSCARRHRRRRAGKACWRRSSARMADSTAWSTRPASRFSAPSRTPITRPGGACLRSTSTARFSAASTRSPLLKRGGGSIVNLSSISGIVGGHNLAAYNASKGGVRLLDQVGRAARRAPQAAGALQLGASGLPRRADGGGHPRADRPARYRARPAGARHSARPAGRAQPRWPTCASICCRTNPASSPAPSSPSTAG